MKLRYVFSIKEMQFFSSFSYSLLYCLKYAKSNLFFFSFSSLAFSNATTVTLPSARAEPFSEINSPMRLFKLYTISEMFLSCTSFQLISLSKILFLLSICHLKVYVPEEIPSMALKTCSS